MIAENEGLPRPLEFDGPDTSAVTIGTLYNLRLQNANIDITVSSAILASRQFDEPLYSLMLGRGSNCDVRIKGVDISSVHCKVIVSINSTFGQATRCKNADDIEEGFQRCPFRVKILDLSLNGIRINGKKINTAGEIEVYPNDLVKFGKNHEYIYKSDQDACDTVGNLFHSNAGLQPYSQFLKPANGPAKKVRNIFDLYQFNEKDLLGKGNFGSVFKAKNKLTKEIVAVKVIQSSSSRNPAIDKEISTLQKCKHDNIMKIIDHMSIRYSDHPVEPSMKVLPSPQSIITTTFLVLEYVESGDLFDKVSTSPTCKLDEQETKFYFEQILDGITYLHEHGIVHRDIKLENILLHKSPTLYISKLGNPVPVSCLYADTVIKIADFGLSKCLGDELFTKTVCGTPQYLAPEILCSTLKKPAKQHPHSPSVLVRPYTKKVDLWSCGIVLFACLFGYFPFGVDDTIRDAISYCEKKPVSGERCPREHLSNDSIALYESLLKVDPEERLDCWGAYHHPWLVRNTERRNETQNYGLFVHSGSSSGRFEPQADDYRQDYEGDLTMGIAPSTIKPAKKGYNFSNQFYPEFSNENRSQHGEMLQLPFGVQKALLSCGPPPSIAPTNPYWTSKVDGGLQQSLIFTKEVSSLDINRAGPAPYGVDPNNLENSIYGYGRNSSMQNYNFENPGGPNYGGNEPYLIKGKESLKFFDSLKLEEEEERSFGEGSAMKMDLDY